MVTQQPLFPLADMPDVELEQPGGTHVTVDVAFAAAERSQLDSTSRAAITSAVEIVTSGRSNSRPVCASCSDVYFACGSAVAGVDRARGRFDRDRDRQGLRLCRHGAKSGLSDVLDPVRHLGDLSLQLWLGRTSCAAGRHDRCLGGDLASEHAVQRACSSQDEPRDHRLFGGAAEDPSGLHGGWPAGLGCTGLAFDQLDLERASVGRSERIALGCPRREISRTRLESPRERR